MRGGGEWVVSMRCVGDVAGAGGVGDRIDYCLSRERF